MHETKLNEKILNSPPNLNVFLFSNQISVMEFTSGSYAIFFKEKPLSIIDNT